MTALDDHRLALAALAGDVGAFERLYRTHCASVHSLCRRLVGPGEADDLTQEVFARAWLKLATFRGEAPFGAWLRTLTVRFLANHLRRPMAPPGLVEEPASLAAATGLRLDLEAAIGRLPLGARAVFVLHDIEGLDHREIAAQLGIHTGTSKSQLHRARALLRGLLAEERT